MPTLNDFTEATPSADWSITPDGLARGRTASGARITIAIARGGAEYDIVGGESGLNDSGGLDTIEQLRDLVEDVEDVDTAEIETTR